MKNFFLIIVCVYFIQCTGYGQESNNSVKTIGFAMVEKAPIFPECENGSPNEMRSCFSRYLSKLIIENLDLSDIEKGGKRIKKVIETLSTVTPGKQNGKPRNIMLVLPILSNNIQGNVK